jgi:predicted nuclease of predicted toxin-antitoxin system
MKRILLDQGLSPAAAILLRARDWDALHVMEAGLDRADDSEILEFARLQSRTCITLDRAPHGPIFGALQE